MGQLRATATKPRQVVLLCNKYTVKLFELENSYPARPVVYVDMDGVLADMWGEVARHHGVDHWRKARKTQKRIEQVAKNPGFFRRLPVLPNAARLIRSVLKTVGEYSILSSPMQSRVEQSSGEKTAWLQHHLKRNAPTAIIFDHNKEKYARQSDGTPNILIDDFETNVELWRARGGIGILYKDQEIDNALVELQRALSGQTVPKTPATAVDVPGGSHQGYFTSREVLQYIKKIHRDYHLTEPVLKHKAWQLVQVPVEDLKTPEKYDQDDPYRRLINLDWNHIKNISRDDVETKPIVINASGWVLDGNHRVIAARAMGLHYIPAYMPVVKPQINS